MKHPPKRIRWFAQTILRRNIYPYQEAIADAVLDSVINGYGYSFTCMMSRQSGKNETSALVEAYLLFCMQEGTIVKAAPTFNPQIINSKLRLLQMLEAPLTKDRIWRSYGYIIGLAPAPDMVERQLGPRVMFFSAGPESNIVGATASLLLEVDEAQDVAIEKYDVQLGPMAAARNATTILWGTAWTDDTLLARQIAHNHELEEQDGIKRHFHFDWTVQAAINPNYKKFVEKEIARLGEDHVSIRTQYRLLPISGAGFLLNELQRHLIRGSHQWEDQPDEEDGGCYILAIDTGGESRPKPGEESKTSSKRDSTILTIGKVSYNELDLPKVEIVHQLWWNGMKWSEQYAAAVEVTQHWSIRKVVIDATGLGEALASLLIDRFGEERVQAFKFSRPSKSKLTYQFLSMVNSGRLKLYAPDEAPRSIYEECWKQLKLARYRVPGEGLLDMYCTASESHDDFLISVALCTEAIRELIAPVQESSIVIPRRLYNGESRY